MRFLKNRLSVFFPALLFSAVHGGELGSGDFQVRIAMPEEIPGREEKIYRPRFDLCGAVRGIRIGNREFLRAPGLADEFGIMGVPPGFQENEKGGLFLKIGVGILENNRAGEYFFYHPYPLRQRFSPRVKTGKNTIEFRQSGRFRDWAYEYVKTYSVDPEAKRLTIHYSLENRGSKPIVTTQYNHNFLALGSRAFPADGVRIRTAFHPELRSMTGRGCFTAEGRCFGNFRTTRQGCYLVSTRPVRPEENQFEISAPGLPFFLRIRGDFPSSRFAVSFRENTYLSPEIFVEIRLPPGGKFHWQRSYEFLRCDGT